MRKMVLVGLIAALAGCADMQNGLHNVNETLKKTNGALAGGGAVRSSALQLGDASGYRPTVNVQVPAGVCDMAAFNDGVKVGYTNSWNSQVRERSTMYQLQAKAKPKEGRLQANVQLYRNKTISTAGLPFESNYQMDVTGRNCRFNSFSEGKSAGMEAAMKDYQALVAIES